jgi:hypothetical protein
LVRGKTCGTQPLGERPVCHSCGSPIDDSDAYAEYKQVTVLFADVVHSMDIAWLVGAERLREIMVALVDRAAVVCSALRARWASLPVTGSWWCSAPGRRSALALAGLGALCQ